ncbi:MAG: hypothetical protein F4Z08_08185 [Chloroflexi bacterium]|nr:hypothetical protein [Chloroflexota bacterium]
MTISRRALKAVAALAALGVVLVVAWLLLATPEGDEAPAATYRLVFAEFGLLADRIHVATPDAPDEREFVASVPHARGWSITQAPAMAGDLVAFTVLPPDALPRRDSPAELWLLDVRSGELTRLAGDADLMAAPVFDPGGVALLYRRTRADGSQELVRIEIATQARRALYGTATDFGVYPVALEPDGSALYLELSVSGTELYRVREGEEPNLIAHVSDHIARDWRVSPDGASLAYLAPEVSAERVVHRAWVVALGAGAEAHAASPADPGSVLSEQFAPVWTADGSGLTVGVEAFPDISAAAITIALERSNDGSPLELPAPAQGFDVPLGWSPGGLYLAARSFDGRDATEPGLESLVVISPGGDRYAVEAESELIYIGWLRDE